MSHPLVLGMARKKCMVWQHIKDEGTVPHSLWRRLACDKCFKKSMLKNMFSCSPSEIYSCPDLRWFRENVSRTICRYITAHLVPWYLLACLEIFWYPLLTYSSYAMPSVSYTLPIHFTNIGLKLLKLEEKYHLDIKILYKCSLFFFKFCLTTQNPHRHNPMLHGFFPTPHPQHLSGITSKRWLK